MNKSSKKLFKVNRIIAMLLVIFMVLSFLPNTVYAMETSKQQKEEIFKQVIEEQLLSNSLSNEISKENIYGDISIDKVVTDNNICINENTEIIVSVLNTTDVTTNTSIKMTISDDYTIFEDSMEIESNKSDYIFNWKPSNIGNYIIEVELCYQDENLIVDFKNINIEVIERVSFLNDEVNYDSKVALVIEKFTLGQGFHTEPTWIEAQKNETVETVLRRFLEEDEYYSLGEEDTFYLSALKDKGSTKLNPPSFIVEHSGELSEADRTESGWLSERDFSNTSGWMYFVNNSMPNVGMGAYKIQDEDVIRIAFTVYGLGADLANSEWNEPLQTEFANYDKAIKTLADFNDNSEKEKLLENELIYELYNDLINKITDLTVKQADLNKSLSNFEESLVPVDKSELNKKIEYVNQLNKGDYTSLSWNSISEKLEIAVNVSNNSKALALEVEKALLELTEAIENLEPLPQNNIEITNKKLFESLAKAAGKEENYSGTLTDGDIIEIKNCVDLSDVDAVDDDLVNILPLLKNATEIKLCNNTQLTSEIVNYEMFDWTVEKTLDFTGCIGIKEIKDYAFYKTGYPQIAMTNLKGIKLPESIEKIGQSAFLRSGLEEVVIPSNVKEFGSHVFNGNQDLKKVVISDGIENISGSMFSESINLKEVYFSNTLKSIGYQSFYRTGIEEIDFPDSLEQIEGTAFWYCTSLKSVKIPSNVKTVGSKTFEECNALESFVIAEGVMELQSSALQGCVNLKEIKLPQSLKTIGDYAFQNTGLSSLDVSNVENFGRGILKQCQNITSVSSVKFNQSQKQIPNEFFSNCENLNDIVFPTWIESIGQGAFSYNKGLTKLTIPSTIKDIESRAFAYCSELEEVYIPSSIETFGDSIFSQCILLKTVTLEDGLNSLGSSMFIRDENLSEIIIPKSIKEIGQNCFARTSINTIDLSNVEILGNGLFDNCKNITNIEDIKLNESISHLNSIFSNCINIEEVKLPEHIKSIDPNTFIACKGITKVDFSNLDPDNFTATIKNCTGINNIDNIIFPSELKKIPNNFFEGATGIKEIRIPESIEEIGSYAFKGMTIADVVIPDNVIKIEERAFENCKSLIYVKMPTYIEELSKNMFTGCSNLVKIDMPDTTDNSVLGDGFFQSCSNLVSVTLPKSITEINQLSFYATTSLKYIDLSNVLKFGVQSISNSGIERLILAENLEKVSNSAFSNNKNLKYLEIPAVFDVSGIGSNIFSSCTLKLVNATKIQEMDLSQLKINDDAVILFKSKNNSKIENNNISLALDETYTIKHEIPSSKNLIWKTTDENIANVDEKGLVTAKKAGVAYIFVESEDKTYNGVIKVSVSDNSDNYLKSLLVSGMTLYKEFSPTESKHMAIASNGDKITISAVPNDIYASMKLNGNNIEIGAVSDVSGLDVVELEIISKDDTSRIYKIGISYIIDDSENTELYEFLPAPGQFINKETWGGINARPERGKNFSASLGNFGGYAIIKFMEPVKNDPNNPYGVDFTVNGNAFSGWSEPGGVMVAQDKDGDGHPDKWYVLAGSEHYEESTVWNYEVTYTNPNPGDEITSSDIPWVDNQGNSGFVKANGYNGGSYYPSSKLYPLAPKDFSNENYTYKGTYITETNDKTGIYFGYSDVHAIANSGPYELPSNPYSNIRRGDPMDISWAVDENGLPVYLDEISFVKVYTAVNKDAGALGEVSTELCGVYRAPSNPITEKTSDVESITITYDDKIFEVSLQEDKYVYNLNINAKNINVSVKSDAENIFVNKVKTISEEPVVIESLDKEVVRIIVQTNTNSPTIYYLNFGNNKVNVDKTKLFEEIEKVKKLSKDDYQEESYKELEEVLISAEEIYNDNDKTQEQVDNILEKLQKSVENLQLKEVIELSKDEKIKKILDTISNSYKNSSGYWESIDMSAYGMGEYIDKDTIITNAIKIYNTSNTSTDIEKAIIAITALGIDASEVKYENKTYNFIKKLANLNVEKNSLGSISGYIYGLLAYDSGNYKLDEDDYWTREKLINHILEIQCDNGNWALSGTVSDPDITGTAIVSLSKYQDNDSVSKSLEKAVEHLSNIQTENGGFKTLYTSENSNSASMVIMALLSLGIDADKDERFIKNGSSVLDSLLSFTSEGYTIGYTNNKHNSMATEQGFRALISYTKFLEIQKPYNMYIFVENENPEPNVVDKTKLFEEIEKTKSLSKGDYTEESYKKLEIVLVSAEEIYNDENKTQEQVDDILRKLQETVENLQLKEVIELSKDERIRKILDIVSNLYKNSSGDWEAVDMSAYGMGAYIDKDTVIKNAVKIYDTSNISTDFERAIIAITALGVDASKVEYENETYNFIKKLSNLNVEKDSLGTINGYIYGLLAYDSGNYKLDEDDYWTREKLIDHILEIQQDNGNWALFGTGNDPDITGMAIVALSKYKDNDNVSKSLEKAVEHLSNIQTENGGFKTLFAPENSNSASMVIVALSSLGIDADKDERFIKNGTSALDSLLSFTSEGYTIGYIDNKHNSMATEQGFRALISYSKFSEVQKPYNVYIFEENENPEPSVVDKTELKKQIDKVSELNSSDYTSDSFENLMKVFNLANDIYNNENSTSKEVFDITEELKLAIESLVKIGEEKPSDDINVTFTLLGVPKHDGKGPNIVYKLHPEKMEIWIPETLYTVSKDSNVLNVFDKALKEEGLDYKNKHDNNYIAGIKSPDGVWMEEFTNGDTSGWMYTVNGKHPTIGLKEYILKDGDSIVFHYTDDYTLEQGSEKWSNSTSSGGTSKQESVEIKVDGKIDNGRYTGKVTDKQIKDAIDKAVKNKDTNIFVNGYSNKDINISEIEFSSDSIKDLVNEKIKLDIKTSLGTIKINVDSLKEISSNISDKNIKLITSKISEDKLSEDQKEQIGDNISIYEFSIQSNSEKIKELSNGKIEITLPYKTLSETNNKVILWVINENGQLEKIESIYNKQTNEIKFTTNELSTYIIGEQKVTEDKISKFIDINKTDWFYESVKYVIEKDLFTGIGENTFGPNEKLTRAMLVTVLYRLENEPEVDTKNLFEDIKETEWYAKAVNWSVEKEIAKGITETRFAPESNITREQLAVMLYRYAQSNDKISDKNGSLEEFSDYKDVSQWAEEALNWATAMNIITGKENKTLDPSANATRAEVATIIQRFIEKIQ